MAKVDYRDYNISTPIREVGTNLNVKGITIPLYTYMSNKHVPNCNTYLELSWIYEMPKPAEVIPTVHSHPYDQITLLMGSDFTRPEYLGAELESTMGDQKMIIDKTNCMFIPKNVPHGHLTWKKLERPHIMMSIMLGTGDFTVANPGALNK